MEHKTPTDTVKRDEASNRSFSSLGELMSFCDKIEQEWFRCQAMAVGAMGLPSTNECVRACLEAETAATMEPDPYRQTGCLAWPISVLVSRGCSEEANAMTARAVSATERVTPTSSRADALFHLLQAAWPLGDAIRRGVVTNLFNLLAADPHWRVRRACVNAACFFGSGDQPVWLSYLVRGCQDTKAVVRIKKSWGAQSGFVPRVYVENRGRSGPNL